MGPTWPVSMWQGNQHLAWFCPCHTMCCHSPTWLGKIPFTKLGHQKRSTKNLLLFLQSRVGPRLREDAAVQDKTDKTVTLALPELLKWWSLRIAKTEADIHNYLISSITEVLYQILTQSTCRGGASDLCFSARIHPGVLSKALLTLDCKIKLIIRINAYPEFIGTSFWSDSGCAGRGLGWTLGKTYSLIGWNRLPRKVLESGYLEVFRNRGYIALRHMI